jgi:hypothetical protein
MNKKRKRFKREEDYLVYQNNERERNRVNRKVEWDIFTKAGLCGICGNDCELKRNGKKQKYCEFHRLLRNLNYNKRRKLTA